MRSVLAVKVIPKSNKNEVISWENNTLKVRLRAIPEKGKANEALIEFLADLFEIAKSQIVLVYGKTSSIKRFSIIGISQEKLNNLLNALVLA